MWAIIGGSGFEHFEGFEVLERLNLVTPFGQPSSGLRRVKLAGNELIFLSRHGQHHELQPSDINYQANIYALKKLGVSKILSISAVGSLREELKPGDLVLPNQYLNFTSGRAHSFCIDGIVGHTSLAKPVTEGLIEEVKKIQSQLAFKIHSGQTYICINGPYFSTKAESQFYRQAGADIIGMTNFPEYALAREAGICYLPACFVTDYDCWDDATPHVTLAQVLQIMKQNNVKAFDLAKRIIANTQHLFMQGCPELSLSQALMCSFDALPDDKKAWLKVLFSIPPNPFLQEKTCLEAAAELNT